MVVEAEQDGAGLLGGSTEVGRGLAAPRADLHERGGRGGSIRPALLPAYSASPSSSGMKPVVARARVKRCLRRVSTAPGPTATSGVMVGSIRPHSHGGDTRSHRRRPPARTLVARHCSGRSVGFEPVDERAVRRHVVDLDPVLDVGGVGAQRDGDLVEGVAGDVEDQFDLLGGSRPAPAGRRPSPVSIRPGVQSMASVNASAARASGGRSLSRWSSTACEGSARRPPPRSAGPAPQRRAQPAPVLAGPAQPHQFGGHGSRASRDGTVRMSPSSAPHRSSPAAPAR